MTPLCFISFIDKSTEPTDDKGKRKKDIETSKYGDDPKKSNENYTKDNYKCVDDGLVLFKDDPLIFKPGSEYEYTSLGYSLISRIVEQVSGENFVDYMENICRDIGLYETKMELNDPIIYNRAR